MKREFCDGCGKDAEDVGRTLGDSYYLGYFSGGDTVVVEVELHFVSDRGKPQELCYECRKKIGETFEILKPVKVCDPLRGTSFDV